MTNIRIELKISMTVRNIMTSEMRKKELFEVKLWIFVCSQTISFIININESKIVDHCLAIKIVFSLFLMSHYFWNITIQKVVLFILCTRFHATCEVVYLAQFLDVVSPVDHLHYLLWSCSLQYYLIIKNGNDKSDVNFKRSIAAK